jgi:hypothetical protein
MGQSVKCPKCGKYRWEDDDEMAEVHLCKPCVRRHYGNIYGACRKYLAEQITLGEPTE